MAELQQFIFLTKGQYELPCKKWLSSHNLKVYKGKVPKIQGGDYKNGGINHFLEKLRDSGWSWYIYGAWMLPRHILCCELTQS